MDIIEAKTKTGRILKMICLLPLVIPPFTIILLYLGYRRLKNIPENDPNHKFLKIVLIYGVCLFVAGGCYLIWQHTRENYALNQPTVQWLPAEYATNVSYYKNLQRELYEFNITEENFQKLHVPGGIKLEEIPAGTPQIIERCSKWIEGTPEASHQAEVEVGLYAEWNEAGFKRKTVYDRLTGRAYYHAARPE